MGCKGNPKYLTWTYQQHSECKGGDYGVPVSAGGFLSSRNEILRWTEILRFCGRFSCVCHQGALPWGLFGSEARGTKRLWAHRTPRAHHKTHLQLPYSHKNEHLKVNYEDVGF